jgi:hypothetical protein
VKRAPRGPSRRYRERAAALAAAIDLALDLTPPALAATAQVWRRLAVQPAPGQDTLHGLATLEEAFLTYWNEAAGDHVEAFWQRVAERGLPFARVDLVRAVVERGGIRTGIERDEVAALLAARRAQGTLAADDERALEAALADFAARAARRTR